MIPPSIYNTPPSQEQSLCAVQFRHNYGYAVTPERSECKEAWPRRLAIFWKEGQRLEQHRKQRTLTLATGAAFAQADRDTKFKLRR